MIVSTRLVKYHTKIIHHLLDLIIKLFPNFFYVTNTFQEYVDQPKSIKLTLVNRRKPATRSIEVESEHVPIELQPEPGKFYAIVSDSRDFEDGVCIVKCLNNCDGFFKGLYLQKTIENLLDVSFMETKEVSKFSHLHIVSNLLSITKYSESQYSVSTTEYEDILFSVNN